MKDTFESLCDKVYARTSYGMREEIAEHRGYKLVWSNNRAEWMVPHRGFSKGDVLRLDANHIAAYANKKDLEAWAPELPALPLYSNSFEARRARRNDPISRRIDDIVAKIESHYARTINRNQLVGFGFTDDEARKLMRYINDANEPVDNVLNYAHSVMMHWGGHGDNREMSHGVEAIHDECYWVNSYWLNTVLLYVNTGDTYDRTLCYDVIDDSFFLGSWGDWWEEHERNHDRECRIGPRRLKGK